MQSETFQQWIALIKSYQGNTSNYLQEYRSDQQALLSAKADRTYLTALQAMAWHVESMKVVALKIEATNLQQQLSQRVAAWGQNHLFHDTYNDQTYQLGYEYGTNGAGGLLQNELTSAQTVTDYQQAIEDANAFLSSFQAYQANLSDTTSWSASHQTDLQLLNHYHLMQQKVAVVSLSEQVLRLYDQGRLLQAFQVTTGRPEKPSLPGKWEITEKESPTVFRSDESPASPYWYPDTPINYAMLYHSGGYFIHDSWWRADYGPGTQFPHVDSSGDSFSFDGSHGCVNLATSDAALLYNYVDLNTHIVIY